MKLAAVETAATSCGKGVIGIKACSNDGKKKKSELEAARRSARGGAAMKSAVQEPTTTTIDEAVASISFPAVALPLTTMSTFFPAAVDGAVM